MEAVGELTIAALAAGGFTNLPIYCEALRLAVSEVDPIFGRRAYGEVYRDAAVRSDWMAVSLITNAEREADGATRLWDLSSSTPAQHLALQIKRHAIDEAMHSRAYLRVLDVVFPGAVEPGLRRALSGISPPYSWKETATARPESPFSHAITLDDLIQMNIAEIRTRIHHLLQRPILELHCSEAGRPMLTKILGRLLSDETAHVGYTARLIERFSKSHGKDCVVELFRKRLRDFDEVTHDELGHKDFE